MNNQEFSIINNNGGLTKATVLTTFTLFDKRYCIYSVSSNSNDNNIYCSRLTNNQLLPITKKKKKAITSQITKEYLKSITAMEGKYERRKGINYNVR